MGVLGIEPPGSLEEQYELLILPHPLLLRKYLIAKAALEHLIFLPLLSKCRDYKCTRQINPF